MDYGQTNMDRTGLRDKEILVEVPQGPLSIWLRSSAINKMFPNPNPDVVAPWSVRNFELIYLAEGKAWIWCDAIGGSIDVVEGDVVFMPPGMVWAWPGVEEVHYSVHFDLNANPDLPSHEVFLHLDRAPVRRRPSNAMPVFVLTTPSSSPQRALRIPLVSHPSNQEQWRRNLETLTQLHRSHAYPSVRAQVLATRLIGWALSSLEHETPSGIGASAKVDHRVDAIVNELNDPRRRVQDYTRSTDNMAQSLGMGVKSFREAFKAATNRRPYQYLIERRMEEAAHMLCHSDLKVYEIAELLGYCNPFYFSHVFSRIYGVSPRKYRQQFGLTGVRSGRVERDESED